MLSTTTCKTSHGPDKSDNNKHKAIYKRKWEENNTNRKCEITQKEMRRKRKHKKRLVTIETCLQLYHTTAVCQTGLEWTQEKRMAQLILYQKMTKIQEKIKLKWEAHLSSICVFCKLENLPLWIMSPIQHKISSCIFNSLVVILQSCILSLPHSKTFHSKKKHGSFQFKSF